MRIAVFGGTFNPLHIGHAMLAETVATEMGYDKVLIVPTFSPPHKILSNAASPRDRLGMARAFCAQNARFEADACEIERGGVSFTYDTIVSVIEKYKGVMEGRPAFVMGQEIAAEFGKWSRAEELSRLVDIIIARRHPDNNNVDSSAFENKPSGGYEGGFVPDSIAETFAFPHVTLQNPMMPLSSTEIRARIASGKSWRYLVPDPVWKYIVDRKLYGYENGKKFS